MSDSKEFHEKELEQVSGGTANDSATFRCPACGRQITTATAITGCEIGEEGPVCIKCTAALGQSVRMIRIS